MNSFARNSTCVIALALGLSFAAVGNIAQAANTVACDPADVPQTAPGEDPAICDMFVIRGERRESVAARLAREALPKVEFPEIRADTIDVFAPTTVYVSTAS